MYTLIFYLHALFPHIRIIRALHIPAFIRFKHNFFYYHLILPTCPETASVIQDFLWGAITSVEDIKCDYTNYR